ncbi:MAG: DoxX family protein [Actinomycetota bacterium]
MVEGLEQTEFDAVMAGFRVIFGLIFAAHGWAKRFSGGGIAGTAGWFDSMGMRPGKVHANLASSAEMLTGVLLALGLLTSFGAAGVIGIMVVAGWTVHRSAGFFIVSNGWEYTFVVGLIAAAIAGLGPGRWSIDHGLGIADDLNGWTGLAIALVVGIAVGVAQIVLFYKPDPAPAESA